MMQADAWMSNSQGNVESSGDGHMDDEEYNELSGSGSGDGYYEPYSQYVNKYNRKYHLCTHHLGRDMRYNRFVF